MGDEPRLACYQQAVRLCVEQLFEETGDAFLDSFGDLQGAEGCSLVTRERLAVLREQFIALVSPSAVYEALLLLETFGVREKLKYLDALCEKQPPLVDGRRHLAPSAHSPLRVFRALRLREKAQARAELGELVSEEEYRVQRLQDEVDDMKRRLEELTKTSQRPLEEIDRALKTLEKVV
ncbi:hypothetical protein CCYA_CCYA19G4680 [Cyanidiococcus yangmingshanensis]|uniref:Uncharacterized protein n=1 Tax=Cyanidiococcus yangmingshanensis TaxID=2690220 RepID=A0A7J7IBS7_9RHOD|nr:hypothetical protein F1559_001618 [Cyanidiococcus yangmingshanensis]KAK4533798.1 hypothetical protein CCYA_CCYA19G4680 [Cyanidiococcus yangmingshanensis]